MIRGGRSIPDYDATFGPIRAARLARQGKQIGDPARAAKVILDVVEMPDPPPNLLLGSDALEWMRAKLTAFSRSVDEWAPTSMSTDFPE